jgi:hypothetical protein
MDNVLCLIYHNNEAIGFVDTETEARGICSLYKNLQFGYTRKPLKVNVPRFTDDFDRFSERKKYVLEKKKQEN